MMEILFLFSLATLYYIHDGYLRLLQMARLFRSPRSRERALHTDPPVVTVLVTVHNEREQILGKIKNILDCEYPSDRLQVLVASDQSDDGTDEAVIEFQDPRVSLFRASGRGGKTQAQNEALAHVTSDIVVFTDADTRFDKQFLKHIVKPFASTSVGAVDGHLTYTIGEQGVAKAQGWYWRYELKLRAMESDLGCLAVLSGPCFAARRGLIQHMDPTIGEDCIIPLDVVRQGFRVVHERGALACESYDRNSESEYRARVRMTLRNWQGTWSRPVLLNPLKHPRYALALWSHKLLRWLSPVFLISLTASAVIGALEGHFPLRIASLLLGAFFCVSLIGWWLQTSNHRIPLVTAAYSFLLANVAFLVGVAKAVRGNRISVYRAGTRR